MQLGAEGVDCDVHDRAVEQWGERAQHEDPGEFQDRGVQAVRAAWEELKASGYSGLTMEGVAARAQTGKQVLYRRWKSRADLVLAAVRHRTGSIVEDIPDNGNLRDDVLAVLQRMMDRFATLGPDTIHGLLAEVPTMDPEVFTRMSGLMRTIVDRAAARGEIPTADLPDRVLTAPINLLRHEMLLTRDPVDPATLTSLVDDIFLPLVRTT